MATLYPWQISRKELMSLAEAHCQSRKTTVIDYRGYLLVSPDRETVPRILADVYRLNMEYALKRGKNIPEAVLRAEEVLVLELCEAGGLPLPAVLGKSGIEPAPTPKFPATPEVVVAPATLSLF